MRWRLDLSYDGTGFHGWAAQPGLRTVEAELELALSRVLRSVEAPRLTCAGRTDAGVHARGQVAHVDLPAGVLDALGPDSDADQLARRLSRALPDDIRLGGLRPAPDGFDARFSALRRRYVYRLCDAPAGPDPLARRHVVHHRRALDVPAMTAAGRGLLGEHDFAAFCRKREGATSVRTLLELSSARVADVVETTVVADAFCRSMVRALLGGLVAVGEGRHDAQWLTGVLEGRRRQPQVTVMPARGLTLEEVVYPDTAGLAVRASQSRRRRDEGLPEMSTPAPER